MNIFFYSDTHFGHANIIRYTGRPFKTLEEMDLTLIRQFNEKVKKDDLVFFLGDFCFRYAPHESPDAPKKSFEHYRQQLKCNNIIFIQGNHDSHNSIKTPIESIIINHGGKRIFMTHDPKYAREEFEINFCGHVHEKWQFKRLNKKSVIVNLSVENWNYRPVNISEINQKLSHWLKDEKN